MFGSHRWNLITWESVGYVWVFGDVKIVLKTAFADARVH